MAILGPETLQKRLSDLKNIGKVEFLCFIFFCLYTLYVCVRPRVNRVVLESKWSVDSKAARLIWENEGESCETSGWLHPPFLYFLNKNITPI